jgi:hypothetical protein
MELTKLSYEEQIASGFTHRVKVVAADLTDTDTAQTLQLFPQTSGKTLPAGTVVWRAGLRLATAFDASGDAAIDSLTVIVGDGSDDNRLIASTQLAVDGTEILYAVTANAVDTLPYAYLAADTIDAIFTCSGGASPTLAEIDSGEVYIYLALADLNKF